MLYSKAAFNDYEDLKRKLGINNWNELTKPENQDKFIEFIEMTRDIDSFQLYDIIDKIPNFLEAFQKINDNIIDLAKDKNKNSEEYIQAIKSMSDSISILLEKNDLTFEERKFVIDKLMELADILKEMHEKDNEFFNNVLKVLGAGVGVLLSFLLYAWGAKQENDYNNKGY